MWHSGRGWVELACEHQLQLRLVARPNRVARHQRPHSPNGLCGWDDSGELRSHEGRRPSRRGTCQPSRSARGTRKLRRRYPRVEVQFIKFQHNVADLDAAIEWAKTNGVDQFTDYWGHLHNCTDYSPQYVDVLAPKPAKRLPGCTWPYFSMQIKYNGDVIPCCYYREGEQYVQGEADGRIVGNVFDTGVWDVWNSADYQALRRIVANPQRSLREPALRKTFCDGCPTIFETSVGALRRAAEEHRWDDLYLKDERGKVWRKDAGTRTNALVG